MPIKRENYALYPGGSPTSKEWKALRATILDRAGNACENCKAPNGILIVRGIGSDAGTYMHFDGGAVHDAETGEKLGYARGSEYNAGKLIRVVLTIAHLDHDPTNNDPQNLKALCQMHHLRHDHEHHQKNAAVTRRSRLASGDLFDQAQRAAREE
jgi:hypothetical protein